MANRARRYTPHPNGYQAAVRLGEQYAQRARVEIDVDEPTVDGLQTLLLLALAFVASGKGKKAFMLLCEYPRLFIGSTLNLFKVCF